MLFNSVVMIIGSFLQGGVSTGETALMGCLPECPGLLQSCRAGCVVTLSLTCLVGSGWRSCVDGALSEFILLFVMMGVAAKVEARAELGAVGDGTGTASQSPPREIA